MASPMSSEGEVVIRARHLAKAYKLYDSQGDWLKQQLLGSVRTYYKSFWALKDISFDVRRGDSVGIIGRNGCGKSTLLQIVCCMTRPTKGEIWVKRHEIIAKFDSIADFAGIGDFMDQPIKLYSTGMRTRLAFAICAHMNAEILIVDEALSVGDMAFQQKCIDWIDNFRRTGTLLFVSHSPSELTRLCNHALWIDGGRVRQGGDVGEVAR